MARIFLCHASEDKQQVREVYQRLKSEGFAPWLDEEDILPGQIWEDEIYRAVRTSDFILIFFSRHSVSGRGFVQRELKLALDAWQDIPEGQIHTIPLRLDDSEIPEKFRRFQWVPLDDRGLERVVRAIRAELANREKSALVVLPPTFTNSIGMEFILIPAGTFVMGSPDSDRDALGGEKPAHSVTISRPFYLGRYLVTQAQWQAVMSNNPSDFQGEDQSVKNVSWYDAQTFIQKLNGREGIRDYRLPTEAEWEYACRAGTPTRYHFGDDATQLREYAWYRENSGGQTHPVGQKKPNAWSLYDMHGNVWEWCQDWFGSYSADAVIDPSGPTAGAERVIRGGSWFTSAQGARSASRFSYPPSYRVDLLGLRCLSSGVSQ